LSDEELVARIWDTAIDGVYQTQMFVHFPQKHCAGIGSKAAAVEIGLDFFGTET